MFECIRFVCVGQLGIGDKKRLESIKICKD